MQAHTIVLIVKEAMCFIWVTLTRHLAFWRNFVLLEGTLEPILVSFLGTSWSFCHVLWYSGTFLCIFGPSERLWDPKWLRVTFERKISFTIFGPILDPFLVSMRNRKHSKTRPIGVPRLAVCLGRLEMWKLPKVGVGGWRRESAIRSV